MFISQGTRSPRANPQNSNWRGGIDLSEQSMPALSLHPLDPNLHVHCASASRFQEYGSESLPLDPSHVRGRTGGAEQVGEAGPRKDSDRLREILVNGGDPRRQFFLLRIEYGLPWEAWWISSLRR